MGIETIIFASLTGLSALSKMSAAQDQAKATVREGALNAENKAKETRYKAARQTTSFLNSGLTLEGTPQGVIDDTYATGIADTKQIISNANASAKNTIASARSEAIADIVGSFAGSSMMSSFSGSIGSMFEAGKAGVGNIGKAGGFMGGFNTSLDLDEAFAAGKGKIF